MISTGFERINGQNHNKLSNLHYSTDYPEFQRTGVINYLDKLNTPAQTQNSWICVSCTAKNSSNFAACNRCGTLKTLNDATRKVSNFVQLGLTLLFTQNFNACPACERASTSSYKWCNQCYNQQSHKIPKVFN